MVDVYGGHCPLQDRMSAAHTPHARFARIAEENLDAAWRVARRCGVSADQLDDVVQEAFIVVSRRLDEILVGRERAFVVGAVVKIAANWRRSQRRRHEDPVSDIADVSPAHAATQEELAVWREERRILDAALSCMTDAQREVFVLTELEQLTAREVSEQLDIHEAAVVSRLRRARETFKTFCDEWQSRTETEAAALAGGSYDV